MGTIRKENQDIRRKPTGERKRTGKDSSFRIYIPLMFQRFVCSFIETPANSKLKKKKKRKKKKKKTLIGLIENRWESITIHY